MNQESSNDGISGMHSVGAREILFIGPGLYTLIMNSPMRSDFFNIVPHLWALLMHQADHLVHRNFDYPLYHEASGCLTMDIKKAVLAWISRDDDRVPEARELAEAAGYEIVQEVRQNRDRPDTRHYLGRGKVTEIEFIDGATHILIPSDITPPQSYNISSITKKSVTDRIRMILEIFRLRANSPESRLQVELADLQHQLPIVREYVHRGKLSEKPGFMAGGEYQVDYYLDMIRRRMSAINRELKEIGRRRGEARSRRRRKGIRLVSLAGYTNAGKSTLMNALIDDERPEKRQEEASAVFTTLSTATRRMKGRENWLITDTVGFISDLPPFLIEGFMSTLEEVFDSDAVILVVDASEERENISYKLTESLKILRDGPVKGKVVIALNKIDRCPDGIAPTDLPIPDIGAENVRIEHMVPTSALAGEGIGDLLEALGRILPERVEIVAEFDEGITISRIEEGLGRRYSVRFVSSNAGRVRFGISYEGGPGEYPLEVIKAIGGIVVVP